MTNSNTKKAKVKKTTTGRPKPVVPKAGFRKGRYGCGGKLK